MATKPTKLQAKARDDLAEALLLIAEAARLDGRAAMDPSAFREIAARIARVSSVYTLEDVFAKAVERRGLLLGFPPSTAEILSLAMTELEPIDILLRDDEGFRELAAKLNEELGEL